MNFEPVTPQNAEKLRPYYINCDYRLCEYSVGVKLMWGSVLRPAFCEAAGCLIVRNEIDGRWQFDFPVAGPEGDVEAALTLIERYCTEQGVRPVISVVPEQEASRLFLRYPVVRLINERPWKDYIYRRMDLAEFAGRHYSGQRNHINKFRKLFPDAEYVTLSAADEPLLERFWQEYGTEFTKESAIAKNELRLAKEMLRHLSGDWFMAGGLLHEGRLVAISMGEKCGRTMQVHIEKALYSCPGAYPTMVQAFAQHCGEDVEYMNREDDARDKGLRTSKTQYLPVMLAGKPCFEVGSELDRLREIPALHTERLTLDALQEKDRAAYNALCLDEERNRLWGYDWRKDYDGRPVEEYFLAVAQEDFRLRRCVNFAVRLGEKCIGEAVLYNLDWRGGAELGCRIAPEYAGCGYGTEAFAAAADWALYGLGLARVVAKCFKENEASYKMLSFSMKRTGEDEQYFYFEKTI
ncbi:MAG: GNAT family N-acetyltransferase [Clostridiales bacterium]|nr:GNAT family N-acetyltransferase [Clostridiales bacterium]